MTSRTFHGVHRGVCRGVVEGCCEHALGEGVPLCFDAAASVQHAAYAIEVRSGWLPDAMKRVLGLLLYPVKCLSVPVPLSVQAC